MFSGASAVNTRVHTYYPSAHEAAGALGTRHSPRPSSMRAERFLRKTSGAVRGEIAKSYVLVALFDM